MNCCCNGGAGVGFCDGVVEPAALLLLPVLVDAIMVLLLLFFPLYEDGGVGTISVGENKSSKPIWIGCISNESCCLWTPPFGVVTVVVATDCVDF